MLAADRSVPVFRAAALQYANFLYLTALMKQPTALVANEPRYCVDALSPEHVKSLFEDVPSIREKGFWSLNCVPVRPEVSKVAPGRFDLVLRFYDLAGTDAWKEELKAVVLGKAEEGRILIPEDRQLALSRLHGRSANVFSKYGNSKFVSITHREIGKIRLLVFEELTREGEVRKQKAF
jgi:hypothetical protein